MTSPAVPFAPSPAQETMALAGVRTFRLDRQGLCEMNVPGETLDQVSLHLPAGTYTTFRTYQGNRFLRLNCHLARLENSNQLLGHPIPVAQEPIRHALAEILRLTGFAESRFRVTVSLTSNGEPGDVYLCVEPFIPWPERLYQEGVRCVTHFLPRREPRAKSTDFIVPSRRVRQALQPGIHEVLIVDEGGRILEGLSSNFFAVMEGTLYTAGEGVLEGVTRSLILEIAHEMLPIRLEPVTREQIAALSEAFITSSSREVVPVVEIDGIPIGKGAPGPLARELLWRYRRRVWEELEPAVQEVVS